MSSNATLDRFQRGLDDADNGINSNTNVDTYTNAGVDGDIFHTGEGYHCWLSKLSNPNEYSSGSPRGTNTAARDARTPNRNQSAAVDVGLDADDMIAASHRLQAAIDRRDPALAGVREINMWLGGPDPVNRDQVLGWRQNYKPNASHKSHLHIAWFRDVADNWAFVGPVLNIILGNEGDDSMSAAEVKALQAYIDLSMTNNILNIVVPLIKKAGADAAPVHQFRLNGDATGKVYAGMVGSGLFWHLPTSDWQKALVNAGVLRPDVVVVPDINQWNTIKALCERTARAETPTTSDLPGANYAPPGTYTDPASAFWHREVLLPTVLDKVATAVVNLEKKA